MYETSQQFCKNGVACVRFFQTISSRFNVGEPVYLTIVVKVKLSLCLIN
jgi:hypothetical protein